MIFIPVQSTVREHRQLKILANSNLFPLFLAKKEIAFEVASFRSKFYCYFRKVATFSGAIYFGTLW